MLRRECELVRFGGKIDGRSHPKDSVRGAPPVGEPLLRHARNVPAARWTLARDERVWIAYGLDSAPLFFAAAAQGPGDERRGSRPNAGR